MRSRFRIAALVAPLVVVLTVWLGYILTSAFLLGDEVAPAQIFDGAQLLLVYFLVFGLPLAYIGSALAIPIYHALQRRNQLRPGYIIGAAALMGALLVPLAWGVFWNRFDLGLTFLLPTGVAAGAAGGRRSGGWRLGQHHRNRPHNEPLQLSGAMSKEAVAIHRPQAQQQSALLRALESTACS